MNFSSLPSVVLRNIISYLSLTELRNLSETNKNLNWLCTTQPLNSFKKFQGLPNDIISLDMWPERFIPTVTTRNYMDIASSWKNIIFFLLLNCDEPDQRSLMTRYFPSNILLSIGGLQSVNIGSIHESVRILDCPWRIMNCPKYISHTLEYINMSEQFYIAKHIDFSGQSLRVLHMNMCRLDNLTFNFSRKLKVVSIFGCTGIKSLVGFENVEKLNMDYCDEIESVEPLKSVKELSMRHCDKITDVSPIKKCTILDISHTSISDISMLKNISSVSVTGLEKLTFNVLRHDIIFLR